MITAQTLTKRYGRDTVLDGLSFCANSGEVTLLIGANGVGKTTTLRILSGLMRPDSGNAWIGGRSIVSERNQAQRTMSYLPQNVAFHPKLSCKALLHFYADLRGVDRARVEPMLARVGLVDHAKKRAGDLSGGLRQRLGLGILLLPDASTLLLDEPGLSLDPEWRQRLQAILKDEAARGKTVLVTTHLLAEWEGVADRCLLCLRGGRVAEIDPNQIRNEFPNSHHGLPLAA